MIAHCWQDHVDYEPFKCAIRSDDGALLFFSETKSQLAMQLSVLATYPEVRLSLGNAAPRGFAKLLAGTALRKVSAYYILIQYMDVNGDDEVYLSETHHGIIHTVGLNMGTREGTLAHSLDHGDDRTAIAHAAADGMLATTEGRLKSSWNVEAILGYRAVSIEFKVAIEEGHSDGMDMGRL